MIKDIDVEEIEMKLLTEAIFQNYGYDYREYSKASLLRRLRAYIIKKNKKNISDLIPIILYNSNEFQELISNISVTVTEMYRNPFVFKMIREKIIPYLKTFPSVKIWVAGCATGEEVYSLAIMLKEEGIYDKATIYATDINKKSLIKAKDAVYSLENTKQNTKNYQKSGGKNSFSNYYTTKYNQVLLDNTLKENIVFLEHNLATDWSINQMHFIICRNVLIYFDKKLQNRVFSMFEESLFRGGFLCLGTKETIMFSSVEDKFNTIGETEKIFQKKRKQHDKSKEND